MAEDKIYRAEAAHRLLNDAVFADALTQVRMDALLMLADVNPTAVDEIRRLQAIVIVTDQLRDNLEAAITASGSRDGGHVLTATRPKANTAN